MKRIAPTACFLGFLLALPLAHARDFAAALPEDTFMIFQVNHLADFQARLKESPMGKASAKIEWDKVVLSIIRMGEASAERKGEGGAEPVSDALIKKGEERFATVKSFFTGTCALAIGDFTATAKLMAQHKKERALLASDSNPGDDLTMEEEERLALRHELLDAREAASIASEFRFYAEVSRGEELLRLLELWTHEDLRETKEDQDPGEFKEITWGTRKGYTVATQLDDDASEGEKALLAYETAPHWALVDGVFVFAATETGLRRAVDALDREPPNRLSRNPRYLDTLAHLGDHDHLFYLNLGRLDGWLRAGLLDPAAPPARAANPMMQMPEPGKILDWLGLDAFEPYVLAIRLATDGLAFRGRFGFNRETSLSRILVDPTDAPAPQPDFVHQDVQQVSSGHWRLSRAYEELEKSLMDLVPQAAMGLGFGRAMLGGQLGIDVKTQLFDHFGGGFVFSQEIDLDVLARMLDLAENDPEQLADFNQKNPTQGRSFLIGLHMANREAVAGALNTLLAKLHPQGLPEAERFLGQEIHFPMKGLSGGAAMESLVSYSFFDDYLVVSIGKPKLMHDAIQAQQDRALRLWENGNFLASRQRMPVQAQMLEFSSGKQAAAALKVMQRSFGMMMKSDAPSAFPDLSPLGEVFRETIGASHRKGLLFDISGFMTFGESR